MREICYELSPQYWNEIRECEAAIFERNRELTPVMFPDVSALEVWSSGHIEPIAPDTIAYSAVVKLFSKRREVKLTMYEFAAETKHEFARVYELDLRRSRETLTVIPVYLNLSVRGLSINTQRQFSVQRKAAIKFGVVQPNAQDYMMVSEQFERGVTGAYTRDIASTRD